MILSIAYTNPYEITHVCARMYAQVYSSGGIQVRVHWETAYAATYNLQVSQDMESWETVFSATPKVDLAKIAL